VLLRGMLTVWLARWLQVDLSPTSSRTCCEKTSNSSLGGDVELESEEAWVSGREACRGRGCGQVGGVLIAAGYDANEVAGHRGFLSRAHAPKLSHSGVIVCDVYCHS